MSSRTRDPLWCFALGVSVLFVLILIVPTLLLCARGFWDPALAQPLAGFWSDPWLWHVLKFTYLQAFFSALIATALGVLLSVLFVERGAKGERLALQLALSAFAVPTVVAALAVVGVWGNQGLLAGGLGLPLEDGHRGWSGILLAHTFLNIAVPFQLIATRLRTLNRNEERVARSLGMGRWRSFFSVTLRSALPEIKAGFWLVFLYCSMSFVIVLLLGGNPRFSTLEVSIYQALKVDLDLPRVARLAALQIISGAALYFLFLRRGRALGGLVRATRGPQRLAGRSVGATSLAWGLLLLFIGAPLLSLFRGVSGFEAGADLARSLGVSVLIAAAVVPLALLWGFALAYLRRHAESPTLIHFTELLASTPVYLSSLILSVAWMLVFGAWLRELDRGRFALVILIQSLLALPLVFRTLRDSYLAIPDKVFRVAQSLGASPRQRFVAVDLPLLRSGLLAAACFAAATSLGEIGSLLVFLPPDFVPLPLAIYRSFAAYRFEQAYLFSLVLVGLIVAVTGLVKRGERWG